VFFSLLGAISSIFLYSFFKNFLFSLKFIPFLKSFYVFFNKKWFFDIIYFHFLTRIILSFGYNITFKLIDRGLIELLGPLGLVNLISKISFNINKIQTGFIYHYVLIFLLGLLFLLTFLSLINFIFFFKPEIYFIFFFLTFFLL
jgi:NADH-ubiquinone oxidoreductase chain 5